MNIKTKYDIGDEVTFPWWGSEETGIITTVKAKKFSNGKQEVEYCISFWNGRNHDWREESNIKKKQEN